MPPLYSIEGHVPSGPYPDDATEYHHFSISQSSTQQLHVSVTHPLDPRPTLGASQCTTLMSSTENQTRTILKTANSKQISYSQHWITITVVTILFMLKRQFGQWSDGELIMIDI